MLFEKPNSFVKKLFDAIFAALILVVIYAFVVALYNGITYTLTQLTSTIFNKIFPVTISIAAALVFISSNPVNGLLALIFTFFQTAMLLLVNGVEYFSFLVLIVYVGAIAILFLFVIMLLNIKELTRFNVTFTRDVKFIVYSTLFLAAITFYSFSTNIFRFFTHTDFTLLFSEPNSAEFIRQYITQRFCDILVYSQVQYTFFSVIFCMLAMLLLTAMLGAIVLAASTTEQKALRLN